MFRRAFIFGEPTQDWKIGLIASGTPALADTAASKSFTEFVGWNDFGAGRVDLRGQTPSLENPSSGIWRFLGEADDTFLITSSGTITGAFVESDPTVGGPPAAGAKLWAGALFASSLSVDPLDVVTIDSYIVTSQANDILGAP